MRTFFEVHLRLVITVWLILLSVLSLLYLMNYMKFDSLMSSVVSSKLEVISASLETSIKRAERLGISFQSADNVKEQIDRARHRESNVLSISLIDQQGGLVYQSRADEGEYVPVSQDVIRRALKSNEAKWTFSNDSELYSGLQITNSFGSLAGSVVIEYDKSALYGMYALVRLHLLEATILIFLVFSLVVFLIIRFGFADVANVIKLIHGYSSGEKKALDGAAHGSMSHNIAEQIKQSEKMKSYVSDELERINSLAKEGEIKR
ncbi:hypothetical protein [Marinomonas balearica]|uniref:Uncharacterized protein n=1 Tax=Marinomonas balearica TaxID=491947 RepID=A0A4R6M950_9GAMM|nr:hypothetical protein [Marinomonas balearica]TDO98021.1 hypothetical protein DFP79_1653 [Marinomonas balearica]